MKLFEGKKLGFCLPRQRTRECLAGMHGNTQSVASKVIASGRGHHLPFLEKLEKRTVYNEVRP